MNSPKQQVPVNRTLVGVIALACLIGGAFVWLQLPVQEGSQLSMLAAALIRVGLLMVAFWVALPTKNREAAWANVSPSRLAGVMLAVLIVAARPRFMLVLIPLGILVLIVGTLLKPRNRRPRK